MRQVSREGEAVSPVAAARHAQKMYLLGELVDLEDARLVRRWVLRSRNNHLRDVLCGNL